MFADDIHGRLDAQIAREPLFSEYFPADLDFAIIATLEKLEEQEYVGDEHEWCHERPILLALLRSVLGV